MSDYRAASGLPDSDYTPAPPNIGLPVDPVPGEWGDQYPAADESNYPAPPPSTHPLRGDPVPLIGVVPYGGVVQSAGAHTVGGPTSVGAPLWVMLGSAGEPRPQAMGVLLWSTEAVAALFELVGDDQQDQVAPGMTLPLGGAALPPPLWLPVRRLVVRGTAALGAGLATFYAAVIGYPTHNDS